MKSFFEDGRDIDILVRSLARKLLREKKTELPPSILARISGVSEGLWRETYSRDRNFLNDLLSVPLLFYIAELEMLEKEERNFIDKLTNVLKLNFHVYFNFPELMVLFNDIGLNEGTAKDLIDKLQLTTVRDEGIELAITLLKKQAYEENIVMKNSTMEGLLFFLILQMMESLHFQLIECCHDYLEHRDDSAFPDEDDMINDIMAPIKEQLQGITAV